MTNREWAKNVYNSKQPLIMKRYRNKFEKHFLTTRNFFRDTLRENSGIDLFELKRNKYYKPKELIQITAIDLAQILGMALQSIFPGRIDEVKDIMREYGNELDETIVREYLNRYDLNYTPSTPEDVIRTIEYVERNVFDKVFSFLEQEKIEDTFLDPDDNYYSEFIDMMWEIDDYLQGPIKRSTTITVTQGTQWISENLVDNFKRNQVAESEWLTTIDGRERPTHAMQDGMITPIGTTFPNGCEFPGDPSCPYPEEVINCRCTILPVK